MTDSRGALSLLLSFIVSSIDVRGETCFRASFCVLSLLGLLSANEPFKFIKQQVSSFPRATLTWRRFLSCKSSSRLPKCLTSTDRTISPANQPSGRISSTSSRSPRSVTPPRRPQRHQNRVTDHNTIVLHHLDRAEDHNRSVPNGWRERTHGPGRRRPVMSGGHGGLATQK